jgi:uridine phosphorylase
MRRSLKSRRVSDSATTGAAPIHLRPSAPLAERALLPGDPGRALALAQSLLTEPRMFNHHRGLWGYTGDAADGRPLTIQATGIGGPSAAIVFSELIALGLRRAIRVGTCGALDPSLALGDLVVAREAICADGTSRALGAGKRGTGEARAGACGAGKRVAADPSLTELLLQRARELLPPRPNAARAGTIVSVDLFYGRSEAPYADQALAVEMEAAALFALGAGAQVQVACLLAVSDTFDASGARTRIDDDALLVAAERMGAIATSALGP